MCLGSGKCREWGVSGAIISTPVAILEATGQSQIIPSLAMFLSPWLLKLPAENDKQIRVGELTVS